jgi:hypothetical protein
MHLVYPDSAEIKKPVMYLSHLRKNNVKLIIFKTVR